MKPRLLRIILLFSVASILAVFAMRCNRAEAGGASEWKNVYDTSVHYVGMESCRSCHEEIYKTFMQTGMGQAFAPVDSSDARTRYPHAPVYDKESDLWYAMQWQGDKLHLREYRLEEGDTVHSFSQPLDYIIGSGQHTVSYLFSSGGYVGQAPIAFYNQRNTWDLAPGYEKGKNTRFSRLIETECMTCHNAFPRFDAASQNKYLSVPHGIDCERCHGPGSLHVAEIKAGRTTDLDKGPDYTIVNPRHLSADLATDLCSRCHLQGIAVLNEGKSFFDHRPGMALREVFNVFTPHYSGEDEAMIMVSHVERMKRSPCFIESKKLSCITCHNPHVSVRFTPRQQYINACQSCHAKLPRNHIAVDAQGVANSAAPTPAAPESGREKVVNAKPVETASGGTAGSDCLTCHMPSNGSIDIPHVAVTDHWIRRKPVSAPTISDAERTRLAQFVGLRSYTEDHPSSLTMARAYLEFYERFVPQRMMLDSAFFYLAKSGKKSDGDPNFIRAHFLAGDFARATSLAPKNPAEIADAWTAYRIGESFFRLSRPQDAAPWYERAVALMPHALDFQNKWGTCLLALGRVAEAQKVFSFILSENPQHAAAHDNLGYCLLQAGDRIGAYEHFAQSLRLDPDRPQTLLNLAVFHYQTGDRPAAARLLKRIVKKDPQHERARAMLADLEASI